VSGRDGRVKQQNGRGQKRKKQTLGSRYNSLVNERKTRTISDFLQAKMKSQIKKKTGQKPVHNAKPSSTTKE